VTGERGRLIGELPAGGRYLRNHAVSPDGRTLAVVDGSDTIVTFDIERGTRKDVVVGGGVELQSVSWSKIGAFMLVTGMFWRGENFAALEVSRHGDVEPIVTGWTSWMWRIQPAESGELATVGMEFKVDLAMLEGL
jgi:hypothetical protein